MDISISRTDDVAVLQVGDVVMEIKDYKISSSMHGGTELEVIIPLTDSITEFSTSATQVLSPRPS